MADKSLTRWRRAGAVFLLLALAFGCKPLALPFYLLNLNKPKLPSHYSFYEKAREAKGKKDIRVAVLVERGRGLSPDFLGAERSLANLLINGLRAGFELNKERVTVISANDVDEFKRKNENWRSLSGPEVAKRLGVDYLFDIELGSMSLYEPGSRHLFRGNCVVSVRVIDADEKAPEIFPPYEYVKEFPGNGVTVAADSQTTPQQFQNQFLAKIALDLTGLFTATHTRDRFQ
jgi:hypothetical protein